MSAPEQLTVGEAMARAATMAEDWTVEEIRRYLAARGVSRGWRTIKRWAHPEFAADDAERVRTRERQRWATRSGGRLGRRDQTRELQEFRVQALASIGADAAEIARVMAFDFPDHEWTCQRVEALVGKPAPLRAVPPPPPGGMNRAEALERAAELRRGGWKWSAIALAMHEYHGQPRMSADQWRGAAEYAGLEFPKRGMTPARAAHLARLQEARAA